MGQSFNFGFNSKKRRVLANRCFLCHEKEGTIDHLLLRCPKTGVLWELLFTLVGVSCAAYFS